LTQNATIRAAGEKLQVRAMPAKKRITNKKVVAGARKVAAKKKIVRKKRVIKAPAPMSAAAQKLAEQLHKAEASAATTKARADELRTKIREARTRLKSTGDGRAKRTIDSGTERLAALNARVVATAATVTKARAELREQARQDAQEAVRKSALAAAVEKFSVKWLKDYDRRIRLRIRTTKKKKT
jgi:hypothetical protein